MTHGLPLGATVAWWPFGPSTTVSDSASSRAGPRLMPLARPKLSVGAPARSCLGTPSVMLAALMSALAVTLMPRSWFGIRTGRSGLQRSMSRDRDSAARPRVASPLKAPNDAQARVARADLRHQPTGRVLVAVLAAWPQGVRHRGSDDDAAADQQACARRAERCLLVDPI